MVLLAFLRERNIAVGISSRAAFYLFVVARVGVFRNFVKGVTGLLVLISFNLNKYFIIYMYM